MDESAISLLRHSWDTGYWTATGTPSDSFLHLNKVESSVNHSQTDNCHQVVTPIHIHFDDCESLSKEEPPSLLLQICTSSITPLSTDNASVLATPASEEATLVETESNVEAATEVDRWMSLRLLAGGRGCH